MSHEPVSFRSVVSVVSLGAALGAVLGLVTGFVLRPWIALLSDPDWLATVIVTEVYAAFVVAHPLVFGLAGMRDRLALTWIRGQDLALALVAWLGVWAVMALAYGALAAWPPVAEMGRAVVAIGSMFGRLERAGPAMFAVSAFQSVVLAPLAEELLHRGVVYGWLRSSRSATVAILAGSAVFALQHPMIALWPMAFGFGVAAGWVRERTGSITPFLVVHALNSVVLLAIGYANGWG
jgi:ABC-2 type transport system permease protein